MANKAMMNLPSSIPLDPEILSRTPPEVIELLLSLLGVNLLKLFIKLNCKNMIAKHALSAIY